MGNISHGGDSVSNMLSGNLLSIPTLFDPETCLSSTLTKIYPVLLISLRFLPEKLMLTPRCAAGAVTIGVNLPGLWVTGCCTEVV